MCRCIVPRRKPAPHDAMANKKKLKTFGPEQFDRAFKSLMEESDRGCVLLTAVWLDEALGELHRAKIHERVNEGPKLWKELTGRFGPLFDFSPKILLGYAYGLLRREEYDDLQIIREIRNDVAHAKTGPEFSFGLDSVAGMVKRLRSINSGPGGESPPVPVGGGTAVNTRLRFVDCGMTLAFSLMERAVQIWELNSTQRELELTLLKSQRLS